MKKIICSVLTALILSSFLVSAASLSFSPTSIVWNAKVGQEYCQNLWISSGNLPNASFEEKWKNKTTDPWSIDMKLTNEQRGAFTNHSRIQNIGWNSNRPRVCYTFKQAGEYHGILLFSPQDQKGNQQVRGGIWLKAVVK